MNRKRNIQSQLALEDAGAVCPVKKQKAAAVHKPLQHSLVAKKQSQEPVFRVALKVLQGAHISQNTRNQEITMEIYSL